MYLLCFLISEVSVQTLLSSQLFGPVVWQSILARRHPYQLFLHLKKECPIETTKEGESYLNHTFREISVHQNGKGKVSGSILVAGKSVGAAVHTVAVQKPETDTRIRSGMSFRSSPAVTYSYTLKASHPSKQSNTLWTKYSKQKPIGHILDSSHNSPVEQIFSLQNAMKNI